MKDTSNIIYCVEILKFEAYADHERRTAMLTRDRRLAIEKAQTLAKTEDWRFYDEMYVSVEARILDKMDARVTVATFLGSDYRPAEHHYHDAVGSDPSLGEICIECDVIGEENRLAWTLYEKVEMAFSNRGLVTGQFSKLKLH